MPEVLPASDFDVTAGHASVAVVALLSRDASTVSTPAIMLGMPGTAEERLERAYLTCAKGLQEFVSEVQGQPWPARGATAHVRAGPDQVDVWSSVGNAADAVVQLRPVPRTELGM